MLERTTLSPTELQQLLVSIGRRGSAPNSEVCALYIVGGPGIGKSALVYGAAQLLQKVYPQFCVVESRAAVSDIVDIKGVPWPERERHRTIFLPPAELPDPARDGSHGFWFIDDFPNAPMAVQNSFYSYLVPPHRLAEHTLASGFAIIAAGNRVEDDSGVYRMGRALNNRLSIVELRPDKEQWRNWAMANNQHEDVIAFHMSPQSQILREHNAVDLLWDFDPSNSDPAFPSPRQWAAVSRILTMAAADGLPTHVCRALVQGTVGMAAEFQFHAFRELYSKLPDISPILEGRHFKLLHSWSIDQNYAILSAVLLRAQAPQVGNVLSWLSTQPDDYSILGVKILIQKFGAHTLFETQREGVDQWLKAHTELLRTTLQP